MYYNIYEEIGLMIKVGVVGYGSMGHLHTECYKAIPEAKVVALTDVEPDRREEAKAKLDCDVYESIDKMLSSAEIDMVDICTPTYLHEEHVIIAARAGKHVLCEKPMSLSVDSCNRMIDAVSQSGITLMVAQVIRFWPEYQVIKQLIDSGQYGKVEWMSARRLGPPAAFAWHNWFADPALSGGAVLDLHIHDQDYIAYLIGSPKTVHARGAANQKGGIDSVLSLGSEHQSGASSYAEASLALGSGFPFSMALLVACEKATFKYDSGADPSLIVYPFDGEPFTPVLPEPGLGSSTEATGNVSALGGYYNEIRYFLDCIIDGRKPDVVTPETARESVRICLAVRESVQTGRVVNL